ncbi:MAG: putative alpha/beta hydrolase [Pseudonocardiales bacterium]
MLSREDLARRAGVDPWTLHEDLTTGDPGAIGMMASAWAKAGGHADESTAMAQTASQRTANAYTVDGAAVHDLATHVTETHRQLGLGGEEMYRVATLLDGISDHLTTSTGNTNTTIKALDDELRTINDNWTTFIQQHGQSLSPTDRDAAREGFINQAVNKVSTYGGAIKKEVDTYDGFLSQNLRSLAELGIVPTDDPGSGDNSEDGPSGSSLGPNQAAWCAAVGPLQCLRAYNIKEEALQKTNELADRYGWSEGQRNAFRHSYWMGLMTVHGFTYDETIALGEAHENDTDTAGELPGSADSNADLHNNKTGAVLGVDVRPWYVGALGFGANGDHKEELEERLVAMLEPMPVCTEDGWLEIVYSKRAGAAIK